MKTFFILFILGFILTNSFFSTSEAFAAGFIKFDGMDGESKDKDHKDWIDLLSFNQGTSRENSSYAGSGFDNLEVSIAKELDKSSPKLAEALVNGRVFPKVEIQFEENDGTYMTYELTNVMITSYSLSGDADDRPTEEISLYYEKIAQYNEPKPEPIKESTQKDLDFKIMGEDKDDEQSRVPNWVQTTATFWIDGNVSDREFTDGIGFLVREQIIEFDEQVKSDDDKEPVEPEVPTWIKDSTKWWIDGLVPEDQFLESIKWLIKNNIIRGVSN